MLDAFLFCIRVISELTKNSAMYELIYSYGLGAVVQTFASGLIPHEGAVIAFDYDGTPIIAAISMSGYSEMRLDEYMAGQIFRNVVYPNPNMPGWLIAQRIRSVRHKAYHLFRWNCWSLTCYGHDVPPPDLVAILAGLALVGAGVAAVASKG